MVAQLGAYRDEIDEAYEILDALRSAPDCDRATRELAYGQQRLLEIALALATRPKVLLLDEPAAGVPREESGEMFDVIAGLSRDIAVLFIEHDMELVFRFAERITVLVGGRVLVEGTPAEIAADPGCARSIWARGITKASERRGLRLTAPLLALTPSAPAMARPSCSTASRSSWRRAALAVLGRNGVGKTTLMLTIMGYTRCAAAAFSGAAPT